MKFISQTHVGLVIALLGLLLSSAAFGQVDGPISIRNMRPYSLLFLQLNPESPSVLSSTAYAQSLQLDIANNLLEPATSNGVQVREDCEYQRFTYSYRRGLNGNAEVAVFVPVMWRNGGMMDGILSWWHRMFGISANSEDNPTGREAISQYQSTLYLTNSAGIPVVNAHNAFGLGDISLTWKKRLSRTASRGETAIRVGLKLPTGSPGVLMGSGAMDAATSLDAGYRIGREIDLYANIGAVCMGHATRVPNNRSLSAQYMLSAVWRANGRDSCIWQVDGASAPLQTGNGFVDGLQSTASFGYRRKLTKRSALTLSFSENGDIHNYTIPIFSNIGPDFTTSARIEWVH